MSGFRISDLTWRARASYAAHLFKATTKQHHRDLRPMFSRYVPADAVIVDAGAHAGQFTKLFARLAPRGHVYSFEPGSYARSILDVAVSVNRLRNVTIVPYGLGDIEAQMPLTIPLKRRGVRGFGLSHLGEATGPGVAVRETIRITTLDRFATENELPRLDLIKADIEGWEQRMIDGGRETIARFRPMIMAELMEAQLARAGDSLTSVWHCLQALGYRPHVWQGAADVAPIDRPREGDIVWLASES